MNTFGNIYRLTSFGESHGRAIGGIIDGLPAGCRISLTAVQQELDKRRPGSRPDVSPRRESDRLTILSGMLALDGEGNPSPLDDDTDMAVTLGTSVGFIIPNTDQRSSAYDPLRDLYRPNHADYTYQQKYGVRDTRGGGRSSGRETAVRVVAGAIAAQLLSTKGITVTTEVSAVGGCTDPSGFAAVINSAKTAGDSVGGVVTGYITGVPAGLGEPVFGKLQQMLASAMLSIGGVHGFEYGDGFALASMRGSETADIITPAGFSTNHCGGILGGISNGEDITF
ncbi:MAG: chorismate synthase, partial [Muribaculaceae bacterium]|nr:chorismate synthase [Muribaculaceae bacterium]